MPVRVKTEDVEVEPTSSLPGVATADEVAREIDVYLSPELCQRLYLLQYPLQHSKIGQLTEARIKPRHGMIELEQPLPNLPKRHYESGEQMLSYVSKRTFRSHTIPVETHMCLGKIKEEVNGKTSLHMVPLQHIVQMRPSLQHIDADQSNIEDNDKTPMDLDDFDDNDQAVDKKPLMFKRKESERATLARKSSYAYKKASEDSEEWQTLEIHDAESVEHHDLLDLVACPIRNQHVLAPPDPSKPRPKYIESLNYMPLTARNDPAQGMVGRSDVKSVLIRLTVLLRNGWPIPYSILRDRFGPEVQDETIFQALAVCAVMVRGNFCLHSRYVALPRILQNARTFILLVLQTKGSIQRARLEMVYEDSNTVTSEKIHVLLNQVAKRTGKGWELRVDDDLAFVSLCPEQSGLHLEYWESQSQSTYFRRLLEKYEQV